MLFSSAGVSGQDEGGAANASQQGPSTIPGVAKELHEESLQSLPGNALEDADAPPSLPESVEDPLVPFRPDVESVQSREAGKDGTEAVGKDGAPDTGMVEAEGDDAVPPLPP